MPAVIDMEKCTACKSCEEICPVGAVKVVEKAIVNADDCIDCNACMDACMDDAVSMN